MDTAWRKFMYDMDNLSVAEVLSQYGAYSRIPTAWDCYLGVGPDWEEEYYYFNNLEEPDRQYRIMVPVPITEGPRAGELVPRERTVNGREYLLPSLANQWRQDFARRVEAAKYRGSSWGQAYAVAPKEFIETGRWPQGVARPVRSI